MIGLLLLSNLIGLVPDRSPEIEVFDRSRLANGAAVTVHRQPGVPVVALRMSIIAADPAGYAGAGHMIQHVQYPSLRDRARRVGGTIQTQRTSDAIVYTVVGPAIELDDLAALLVDALRPPQAPIDVVLRAERELREERLAEWETAESHTRSHLRAQMFPADVSAAGTDRASTRFSVESLPEIWAMMYQPDRVSVVAVGDVHLSDVESAFAGIPAAYQPRQLEIERDSLVLTPLAPPQATRAWLGTGYLASDLPASAVSVATRLLGDFVRDRVPAGQVEAEHWWTHHGQAVVLIVSVPEADLAASWRLLNTAVPTLLDRVDFLDVVEAAAAIRREMLFHSRTPDRMAEVIGQFIDRDGDPNATEAYYTALENLDDEIVRTVLETLAGRTPARVEVPPQALRPRRR